jgi:molybdopterin converting factor small subunit
MDMEDGATVSTLLRALEEGYPGLSAYSNYLMTAVNSQYVERTHSLQEGDEVAFVPPVSGGC